MTLSMGIDAEARLRLWRPRLLVAPVVFAAALMTPAMAQDRTKDETLAELRACASIADDAQRLTCFDAQASALITALDAGQLQLVERKEIERTRRSLFGFSMPKLDILGGEGAPDMLETTITGVKPAGRDGWAIEVAEGSTWQITNAPSRLRAPKIGDAVVIKKAALGSFFIRIGGQLGVKGRRVS